MTNLTGNHGSLFSRTTATGLALLLFLSLLPACAARHMPDWSRVQTVPPKTKTDVQLYKDDAPQGSRKIQGRFDSATTASLTLTLKDGQTRTLPKQAVRKVLTRRPFSKRWPGWVALGVTAALVEILLAPPSHDIAMPRLGHVIFTLPTAAAFFYGSRMGGIYEVSPKHRTRTQGAKQSGAQSEAPGKPEEPRQALLDQIPGRIVQVSGDGAYDTRACYQSILEREAVATIPPRRSARLSESVDPPAWRAMRDAHLREIRRLGRYEWRISSGCTRQSLAENAMSRFKTLFGPKLSARRFDNQRVEAIIKCEVLNRMSSRGMPESVRIR